MTSLTFRAYCKCLNIVVMKGRRKQQQCCCYNIKNNDDAAVEMEIDQCVAQIVLLLTTTCRRVVHTRKLNRKVAQERSVN